MGGKILTWPEEVEPIVKQILDIEAELQPILKVCIVQGIEEMHFDLIKIFNPKIERKAERIQDLCYEALTYYPVSGGRNPKWVNTIDEIIFLAHTIEECAVDMRKFEKQHLWGNVKKCLTISLKKSKEIHRLPFLIPVRRHDVPVPFREAFEQQ